VDDEITALTKEFSFTTTNELFSVATTLDLKPGTLLVALTGTLKTVGGPAHFTLCDRSGSVLASFVVQEDQGGVSVSAPTSTYVSQLVLRVSSVRGSVIVVSGKVHAMVVLPEPSAVDRLGDLARG